MEAAEHRALMDRRQFSWGPLPTGMKQFGVRLAEVRTFAATNAVYVAVVATVLDAQALEAADFSRTIDAHIFKSGVYTFRDDLSVLNGAIRSIRTC